MTIVTPPPEIGRDRYGRPMVIPPRGGKPQSYTRCTTYIDVLEDKYNLQKWMQRMVALGLAGRPDLLLSVSAHAEDKRELDRICEKAREAAQASAAATTGTALHALTELVDRGQDVPPVPPGPAASLEAYRAATADLRSVHIERFTVLDTLKIGGTPDRVVEYDGELYIADIKTGSIDWGVLKIAMQLAVYSRAWLYDIATGERTAHGASTNRGLIIHLPSTDDPKAAKCELVWVDLEAGWEAVKVAGAVREQRALKFDQLAKPFGKPDRPSLRLELRDETRAAEAVTADHQRIEKLIRNCATADLVRGVWESNSEVWTDDLTTIAREHIAGLQVAS